ncbi:hypothetical protein P8V03_11130 [Clostridium sp. A1-XYC3]|uniref:ABC transporter permease n=1 Tax=Clostridium tanneri TaxID=3037988 RepID=A0ABU4JUU1_9CLOT|nr:hypothetical protein [Clostridium sp. A1-XYC3]MDW8801698.1 hypothetical protein [Clostridium sp. A1-XYC3]
MFNLVKYELKGYYKDFIIILSAITLANLFLFTVAQWPPQGKFFFSTLITFAAMIVVFVWNIKLFSRDMYEDSGYLLFTLPQSGYSILGAKLVTTIIQVAIVGLVAGVFNLIHLRNIVNFKELFSSLPNLMNNVNIGFLIFLAIISILEYVYFLLSIYFSISLSKVAIKNKKMGKLGGFVIFIVLSLVVGKITQLLTVTFPEVFNINILTAQGELNLGVGLGIMVVPVNIAAAAFNILFFMVMYIATAFILEKKVDF